MIVELFVPCFIDHYFPDVAHATVKILEHCGCTVNYNENQTCCGRPAIDSGNTMAAYEVGEKFIHDMLKERYIVVPSAYCTAGVVNYYAQLYQHSKLHNECKALQTQVFELTDFIVQVLKLTNIGSKLEGTAWYMASCHAQHDIACNYSTDILLAEVEGLKLYKRPIMDCCGSGGRLAYHHPSMAAMLARQMTMPIDAQKVEMIISNDMMCLHHLQQHTKHSYRYLHVAEVLASGL